MPEVAGKRVLIFGDSLSSGPGSPGDELAKQLTAAGATVKLNAVVGRSANNFYGREDTTTQLAAIRAFGPDIAIVELGTNDIGLSIAVDGARMAQLRNALAPAEVWAIGPPTFPASGPGSNQTAGEPAVVRMMRDVFGARFIDLRPLTADMAIAGAGGRAADGTHFTFAGGQLVGTRVAREFLKADSMGIGGTMFIALLLGTLAWVLVR